MPRFSREQLERFAERVLTAAGMTAEDARVTGRCLLDANLRGVDSHGILRVPEYVDRIARETVNVRPAVSVVHRAGAMALVDADDGFGYRPALLAADMAVELAAVHGIGFVGVQNTRHFGMAAIYTNRVAAAGMIGIATTTTMPRLGPPGAMQPVVGNNPISIAVPRQAPQPPILLDMALANAAMGKIKLAAAEGRPIPPGWAYDRWGQPTTDPHEALHSALQVAIGEYKGYGLSVMVELLAGVMTGSKFRSSEPSGREKHRQGHVLIAINTAFMVPAEQFAAGVENLVRHVKSAPMGPAATAIYMPGEIEGNVVQHREQDGIPLTEELVGHLQAVAQRCGVAPLGEGRVP